MFYTILAIHNVFFNTKYNAMHLEQRPALKWMKILNWVKVCFEPVYLSNLIKIEIFDLLRHMQYRYTKLWFIQNVYLSSIERIKWLLTDPVPLINLLNSIEHNSNQKGKIKIPLFYPVFHICIYLHPFAKNKPLQVKVHGIFRNHWHLNALHRHLKLVTFLLFL